MNALLLAMIGGVLMLAAGVSLRAQDAPGGEPAGKCPEQVHKEAVEAATKAKEAEDKLDKDPRKPPAGRFKRHYEEDVDEADRLAKATAKQIDETKKTQQEVQKEIDKIKAAHPGYQRVDLPQGVTVNKAQEEAQTALLEIQTKIAAAMRAEAAYDSDPQIVEIRKELEAANKTLADVIKDTMAPGTGVDQVLTKLNDTGYRDLDPAKLPREQDVKDADEDIQRDKRDKIRDQVLAAANAVVAFKTFTDPQLEAKRNELQVAINATGALGIAGKDPWIEARRLASELIGEIDRVRLVVFDAYKPVSKIEDRIAARIKEIDPDGADKIAELPDLRKKQDEKAAQIENLKVQKNLLAYELGIQEGQRFIGQRAKELVDRLTDLSNARIALKTVLAYDTDLEAAIKVRKAADDAVVKAKEAMDKDLKDMEAAVTKAEADYLANEQDLAHFRTLVNAKKGEILADKERGAERLIKLKQAISKKKQEAIAKLNAIKAALDKYANCHSKAAETGQKVSMKINALGGAGAALAVGDDQFTDPFDIPVDKGVTDPLDKPKPGDLVLVDPPELKITELRSMWTADAKACTAKIDLGNGGATYSWKIPSKIGPGGESITVTTNPYADKTTRVLGIIGTSGRGVTFDIERYDDRLAVVMAEPGENKTATKTVRVTPEPGRREISITVGSGYSVVATYTYRAVEANP